MSLPSLPGAIADLKELFDHFRKEVVTSGPSYASPLLEGLAARALTAVDDGLPVLDLLRSSNAAAAFDAAWWSSDGELVGPLEELASREEDPRLRWLLIAYWVVLCDFDRIAANLEPLAAVNLNELTWLVAGALWVQWRSSQPTTSRLREALITIRERCPSFDAHLLSVLGGPPGAVREAAHIIRALLADPRAELPRQSVESGHR